MLGALRQGRSETTPVIVLAGVQGGEGKSLFLKPLFSLFDGFVFNVPKTGNFPLLDLMGAKVAFLDEYRFNPDVLSWADHCLWFDGSHVPIGRPQNEKGPSGNMTYKGTAPIFITTKLADMKDLEYQAQMNPDTGLPWDTDASMLLRRLKVFKFGCRKAKPSKQMKFCSRCFTNLLYSNATEGVGM